MPPWSALPQTFIPLLTRASSYAKQLRESVAGLHRPKFDGEALSPLTPGLLGKIQGGTFIATSEVEEEETQNRRKLNHNVER